MKIDFDTEIDRRHTDSIKWEFVQSDDNSAELVHTDQFFGEDRKLPLWVADMDFRAPQPVIDAIVKRAEHGILGYTGKTDSYFEAVIGWMKRRHSWDIERESIVTAPGVVLAICHLVRTFVAPGEKVLIQSPVYYPFTLASEWNGAQVAHNPLILKDGRYTMNFDDLEAKASDPNVKMAILCSPHNPIGRVWSPEELRQFAEICFRHDVLVVSDEIHMDLIMRGNTFTPIATLGEEIKQKVIVCTSGSKTFNLAGLHTSNIIITDQERRARYEQALRSSGLFSIDLFGKTAQQAAYNHGEEWLEQLLDYLTGNLEFLKEYLAAEIPQLSLVPLEGTYLVWVDCRGLDLSADELKRLMIDVGGVYLDEGVLFGSEGSGFERINLACPRSVLKQALDGIKRAVDSLNR